MFPRILISDLDQWKQRSRRKPLILRGARQTGKTTLIRQFGKTFESFVELNLERHRDQQIFQGMPPVTRLLQTIEGVTGQKITPGKTLLFLDEIQNTPEAIQALRYFYEDCPELHVISTGSLLEVRMKQEGWSYPVGRVEFLYLYPMTFEEVLMARQETILLEQMKACSLSHPLPAAVMDKARELLLDYLVVGGMPAAVRSFVETGSFLDVRREHEALTLSFEEDFRKYARAAEVPLLRSLWERIPHQMGQRIVYSRLMEHEYRSVQISQAIDLMEDAMLVQRILPTVYTEPPFVKKTKAAPKLLFVDIGLALSIRNLSLETIKKSVLGKTAIGGIWESYVGQEILASEAHERRPLYFWMREEKGSSSEVDYLLPLEGKSIPVEVKSASHGALRGLHQYLLRSQNRFALRIHDGPLSFDRHEIKTPQGDHLCYQLLSCPLMMAFRLGELVRDFSQTKK